jgi:hypothetical protein
MALRPIKWVCNGAIWGLICCGVTLTSTASPQRPRTPVRPQVDYTRFSHLTEKHRAACKSCHTFPSKNWKEVRKGDDAFPDVTEYPEHQTCLGCHRQQFFARERPVPRICSNCHVKATPVDTARYPFPRPGDFVSDFRVVFPREKHTDLDQTQPLNHATCFTCHNQESELPPLPPNCDSCHKPR